jgi:hypothetical protein
MVPLLYLVYQLTQPGRIPSWLYPTAFICFFTPMLLVGVHLVLSLFSTKRERRALLEDLNFAPINQAQLKQQHTDILTDPHQEILELGANLDNGWEGFFRDMPVELIEFSTVSGNNKIKTFLASTEVYPPANTVCIKRPLIPFFKRMMPKQLRGIGSAHMQRHWLIYGDEESATHLLSDSVCSYFEQLPKYKFLVLWSHNRLYFGLIGLPTREGAEYLLQSCTDLARIAKIAKIEQAEL